MFSIPPKMLSLYQKHLKLISVPDKRGVSGQKPEKAGHQTWQNKWATWEVGRPSSIDPSKLLVGTLPLKVI